ncbi:MAG: ABC transporter ATP-binding protein, partial [Verrucomicrobiales bacterium]
AEIDARVEEMLGIVRLDGLEERSINALSGGQQQRVALARALAVRPQCLFLDEPLSNLDAQLRLEMRGQIHDLCKEYGLTAVYVTHDQKEALSVADRLAILEDGRLVQVGTPRDVYRAPRTCSVAQFIGETNFIGGMVKSTHGRIAQVDTDLGHFEGVVADPNWLPQKSDLVVIAIRPESLTLDSLPCDGTNTIDGHISQSTYLGEIAQYDLKATDGSSVRVSELNPSIVRENSKAWLHAHAEREDVIVLQASPGMVQTP